MRAGWGRRGLPSATQTPTPHRECRRVLRTIPPRVLQTYLRLANVPFAVQECSATSACPTGQLPALDTSTDLVGGGGREGGSAPPGTSGPLAESGVARLIVDYLKRNVRGEGGGDDACAWMQQGAAAQATNTDCSCSCPMKWQTLSTPCDLAALTGCTLLLLAAAVGVRPGPRADRLPEGRGRRVWGAGRGAPAPRPALLHLVRGRCLCAAHAPRLWRRPTLPALLLCAALPTQSSRAAFCRHQRR